MPTPAEVAEEEETAALVANSRAKRADARKRREERDEQDRRIVRYARSVNRLGL
jgi:hypothetical protein